MRLPALLWLGLAGCVVEGPDRSSNEHLRGDSVTVRKTEDFDVSGDGSNAAWSRTAWTSLRRRQEDGHPYEARFKLLYSESGVYVLMDGTDTMLTTTGRKDFEHLWEEDVYEAFLWPRKDDAVGLGAGRPELPRVLELRHPGV